MLALLTLAISLSASKRPYSYTAQFVEGCSCKDVCVTEITGRDAGCHGLGAMRFLTGRYGGRDLSGACAAFAWDSGKWVRIYIDAPPAKRDAVTAFMTSALADWGKLESVTQAKIAITHERAGCSAVIDNGRIGAIHLKPVLGGDGRSPVTYTNLASPLHAVLMQGVTTSGRFAADHPFALDKSNGFYNFRCSMRGRL